MSEHALLNRILRASERLTKAELTMLEQVARGLAKKAPEPESRGGLCIVQDDDDDENIMIE